MIRWYYKMNMDGSKHYALDVERLEKVLDTNKANVNDFSEKR
jgi:hypothetical protein